MSFTERILKANQRTTNAKYELHILNLIGMIIAGIILTAGGINWIGIIGIILLGISMDGLYEEKEVK